MSSTLASVLIVDDEELTVELYAAILENAGYTNLVTCSDSREVLPIVRTQSIGIVLLDLKMPHISGNELLERLHADYPQIAVIVLTSVVRVETAVECMKQGAFDYIAKPVEEQRLINAVEHAITIRELREEVAALSAKPDELEKPAAFQSMTTANAEMRRLFRYVEAIAPSPKAVLITGESGTGKELLARAVHEASGRAGEFVAVNVSGLDDAMFSDTLFGHVRGAYTGADNARKGLIQTAREGTLFLDEIGDLPAGAQVKLLRLLQDGDYYPIGSDQPVQAAVRIVTATNADIGAKQQSGTFRRDLYYRLISHRVHIPPLRERADDIPLLLKRFANEAAESLGRMAPEIPDSLPGLLSSYSFPGNIRELQAIVFDAVTRSEGRRLSMKPILDYIGLSDSELRATVPPADPEGADAPVLLRGTFPTLQEVEEFLMREALERVGGNQTLAAKLLGVSQSTLSRRLRDRTP